MPITSAWTAPATLDRNVGDVLSEAIWDNLVSNELYLWDTLHGYARQASILSILVGAADTILRRHAANVLATDDTFAVFAANGPTAGLTVRAGADTNERLIVYGSGTLEWGPGNAAGDVNLYRAAANVLKTDDSFYVVGDAIARVGVAAQTTIGDNFGDGRSSIFFGSGGDTKLYRPAANTLKTDGALVVVGDLSAPNVMTRLAETTLGSPAASIGFASIPATYRHLRLVLQTRSTAAVSGCNVLIRFNSDAGVSYTSEYAYAYGATQVANSPASTTSGEIGRAPGTTGLAGFRSVLEATISDYAGAYYKSLVSKFHGQDGNSAVLQSIGTCGTYWSSTVAINRIDVFLSSGNLDVGTTASLYGL